MLSPPPKKLKRRFQAQKKQKNKKIRVDFQEWLQVSQKILEERKKSLSLWARWRSKADPEKEVCKELIKRLDQKKVAPEEAYSLAQRGSQNLQELQKQLFPLLVYLLGGGSMLLCSIVFFLLRMPHTTNWTAWQQDYTWVVWLILTLASAVAFTVGLRKRATFQRTLLSNSVLSQASSAYAASRVQGQGGSLFEAYQQLEIIRRKIKENSAFSRWKK